MLLNICEIRNYSLRNAVERCGCYQWNAAILFRIVILLNICETRNYSPKDAVKKNCQKEPIGLTEIQLQ